MSSDIRNVIIVGSGPAGLTAAIYAARAQLEPLVIEGEPSSTSDQPGGQLMLTTDVENYPGFPTGVMGPDLMLSFRQQAERFGAELLTAKATKVSLGESPFTVSVGDDEYRARSVIVSTGAQSLMLGIENEERLIGHGVSTCATCDGFFFRDQEIAVVGGGDSALEEAQFLTRFASKVYLIHRRDKLRASRIMQERTFDNDKIEILWNNVVSEIHGDERLTGLTLAEQLPAGQSPGGQSPGGQSPAGSSSGGSSPSGQENGGQRELPVTGMFVAIGHIPNTGLFTGQLDLKPNGYLVTKPDSTATNVEGVFACGDVQDDYFRQAITAAGSGCMAAIEAERWLETQGH